MEPNVLYSSQISPSVVVKSFTSKSSLIEDAKILLELARNTSDPLKENYGIGFDWKEHKLISLSYYHGRPVMISTLQNREFYGPHTFRCLSRVWKLPSMRRVFGKSLSFRLQTMLQHQVQFLLQSDLLSEFVFISNLRKSDKIIRSYSKGASSATGLAFKVPKSRTLVCPNPTSPSCWQWICWAQISGTPKPFPLQIRRP